MTDFLYHKAERLRRIMQGEESYDGVGSPAQQARAYRHEVMLPAAAERIRRMPVEKLPEPVDLLISLSGFSPETSVFAYEFLRPEWLTVIVSRSASEGVDIIADHVRLRRSRLDIKRVEPTDLVDIYRVIKESVGEARRADADGTPRMIVDITGGKKAMSAGAAYAAAQLDLRLCYIDGDFDVELRQSRPGTERIVILDNPTKLFGDKEMDAALMEFELGHYGTARERFERISKTAPEPARARFGRDLASLYEAWCELDFKLLAERSATMRVRLADRAYRAQNPLVHRLTGQLDFLDELAAAAEGSNLLLNFYLLGYHYQQLGRYDFAALLYYRAVEKLFTLRLEERGFSCAAPDWERLSRDRSVFTQRYEDLATGIHGRKIEGLPSRVGLLDAALLLYILGDRLTRRLGLTEKKPLSYLKRLTETRNRSVLAHGVETVTPELSDELRRFALRGLVAHWGLYHGAERVEDRIIALRFVGAI